LSNPTTASCRRRDPPPRRAADRASDRRLLRPRGHPQRRDPARSQPGPLSGSKPSPAPTGHGL